MKKRYIKILNDFRLVCQYIENKQYMDALQLLFKINTFIDKLINELSMKEKFKRQG